VECIEAERRMGVAEVEVGGGGRTGRCPPKDTEFQLDHGSVWRCVYSLVTCL
jgi:hypothetical protein